MDVCHERIFWRVIWEFPKIGDLNRPGCFFFVVAPFCSCPASLVSRKFFAVGPGCAKCFFLLRSVGRRDLSAGPEQKKNTTQGVFFLLRPRGKAREGEAPLEAGTGPEQKKKTPPRVFFFFAAAPAKGKGRRSPVGSRHGARAKKKHQPGCFFLLRPRGKAGEGEAPLGAGTGPEQKVFFLFCSSPVPAPNGASPSLAFRRGRSKKKKKPGWCFFFALAPCRLPTGLLLPLPFAGAAAKKKHPGWCFFFCSGPVPASNGASPSLAFRRGRSKKKNTLGGAFFFAAAPRGRSLTHCGPGWRCLPLAGAVFFFSLRPRPDRGGVFFCCGPARTVTHSRWAGAISARPGWCFFFFAAAPPGLFRQ